MYPKQRPEPSSEATPSAPDGQAQIANFPRTAKTAAASPREKPSRQAVLVLGMHRSGTSAVTEALSFLGGRLPARLLPPQPDNPRGFFEPQGMVEIHDRMLASAGTSWADWDAFPASWYTALEADGYVRELTEAVKADYGSARILLLKDPRICRFLPLWTRVLSELKIKPLFVLSFRNPLEVATSLRHRNGFSLAHTYLLWLRHVLDAEFGSRDFPRTFVRYEDFLSRPRGEIDRLETQIPVIWPRKSARAYYQIEKAAEVDFRHYVASADDLVSRSDVFAWMREAYQGYERLRDNPVDPQALRSLDRVRLRFDEACAAFAPALQGLQIQTEEQANELLFIRQELANAQQKSGDLEALARDIPGLQRAHEEAQAALAAARQTIDELSAVQSRTGELQSALASESDRANRAEAAMLRIPELELEIGEARSQNEQLKTQIAGLSALARERDGAIDGLAAASARIDDLEAALAREKARTESLAKFEEIAARVPALEEMLRTAQAERKEAREACEMHANDAARQAERVRLLENALQVRREERPPQNWLGSGLRYLYWAISFQFSRRYSAEQRLNQRMRIALESGLLDPEWYLHAYPDVAAHGIDPLRHYCESGFLERRHPSANADAASVSALNSQLRAI